MLFSRQGFCGEKHPLQERGRECLLNVGICIFLAQPDMWEHVGSFEW